MTNSETNTDTDSESGYNNINSINDLSTDSEDNSTINFEEL